MLKKSIYFLPLLTLVFTLNACSTHAYNEKFGLVEDAKIEEQLANEVLISDKEIAKFNKEILNEEAFKPAKGTFLAEDWVKPKVLITYLYPYDSKFYREDELPENKGRLGNVIIKVPDNMDKEEVLSQLNRTGISY